MQWIKNQSITVKMVFLVGTMLILTIILSSFSLFKMNRVAEEVKGIAHEHIPLIQLVSDATVKQLQSALIVEKALRAADFSVDVDAEELQRLQQNFSLVSQTFDQEVQQAQSNLKGMLQFHKNEVLEKEQRLLQHLNAVIVHHRRYEDSAAEILQAIIEHQNSQILSEKAQQLEAQQTAQNQELGSLLAEVEKTHRIIAYANGARRAAGNMGDGFISGYRAIDRVVDWFVYQSSISSFFVLCLYGCRADGSREF